MPNPQFIVQEILPAMQKMLGASNVMQEAAVSEPNMEHFDPDSYIQASPLVNIAEGAKAALHVAPETPGA